MLTGIKGDTYFVFGGCPVWVWFCMPDTEGIPLENMDLLFGVPNRRGTGEGAETARPTDATESWRTMRTRQWIVPLSRVRE